MRKLIVVALLAATALLTFANSSDAGFILRVPFVNIHINHGVRVGAGPLRIDVPPPASTIPGPMGVVVSETVPAAPVETLTPPQPLLVKPLTVEQFAAAFKPVPGRHEVILLHPKSSQPVKVCFDLPPGCPRKVRYTRHVLEFDYGRDSVRIRFYHDGDVKVLN